MEISIILPTYNERENIPVVVSALAIALQGIEWEAIFVDDDSPDGTAAAVRQVAESMPNIRLLHRIGRRGLASACIEGMHAASSPVLAVMDADMQHDERILPVMLRRLHARRLDLVVGSRNTAGGSMGDFSRLRVALSRAGQGISRTACRGAALSDPMSGFFALSQSFFREIAPRLRGEGFKILVDILSASSRTIRFDEIGYTFRRRQHGESKLGVLVGLQYLAQVARRSLSQPSTLTAHRGVPHDHASSASVIVGTIS